MNNNDIIKMVRAGVAEDVVMRLVNLQPGKYTMTTAAIIDLKKARVPDKVTLAIIAKIKPAQVESEATAKAPKGTIAQGASEAATRIGLGQTSQDAKDTVPKVTEKPFAEGASEATAKTAQTPTAQDAKGTTARVEPGSPAQSAGGPTNGTSLQDSSEPTVDLAGGATVKISQLTTPFIGTGWLLTANGTDYKVLQSTNVLQATGLGHKTPDLLLGVAFNTRLRPQFWRKEHLVGNINDPHLDAFVSLKLTPGSQNTLNGFVFGGAMRIHPNLDIVVGLALTPQNAPSIGLRQAAYLAALSDRVHYAAFAPRDLLLNKQQAFDGFPLLVKGTGQALFPGEPLTTQYRNGLFIGVSFPVSLGGIFKIPSGETTVPPKPEPDSQNPDNSKKPKPQAPAAR